MLTKGEMVLSPRQVEAVIQYGERLSVTAAKMSASMTEFGREFAKRGEPLLRAARKFEQDEIDRQLNRR